MLRLKVKSTNYYINYFKMKIKNYVDVYVKGINLTILTRLTVSVLLIHVVRRKNNCRQLSEKKRR